MDPRIQEYLESNRLVSRFYLKLRGGFNHDAELLSRIGI